MPYPPRIPDESVLSRWIGLEVSRMNEGLVRERLPLALLLSSEKPSSVTRNGELYQFDRDLIENLEKVLPDDLRHRLKLPIFFYLASDTPDSCSCPDEAALSVLQLLGEINPLRTMQGERFWISRPIVYAIQKKYPTMIQIVMGV
ncbi:MAG TPA: DUF61 family protein [Methanoregulaceae archaeon]|nr:DUF61 family protein [Methanoregulaceae archaeon]